MISKKLSVSYLFIIEDIIFNISSEDITNFMLEFVSMFLVKIPLFIQTSFPLSSAKLQSEDSIFAATSV